MKKSVIWAITIIGLLLIEVAGILIFKDTEGKQNWWILYITFLLMAVAGTIIYIFYIANKKKAKVETKIINQDKAREEATFFVEEKYAKTPIKVMEATEFIGQEGKEKDPIFWILFKDKFRIPFGTELFLVVINCAEPDRKKFILMDESDKEIHDKIKKLCQTLSRDRPMIEEVTEPAKYTPEGVLIAPERKIIRELPSVKEQKIEEQKQEQKGAIASK